MAEIADKKDEEGWLGYLDIQDDIERLLPGPSERERNESRLREMVTGEPRPISHIDHETKAWAHNNVTLPLMLAFLRGASLSGRALSGAKAIDKSSKFAHPAGFQGKMRPAQKMAKEEVKETGKALKEAKKEAPKKLFERFMHTVDGVDHDKVFDHRIAKQNKRNIDTAIDILSKNPGGRPGDVIEDAAVKSAAKVGTGAVVGNKAAKALVDNVGREPGTYDKGIDGHDDRIEMGIASKAMHFLKGLTGADELDPSIWPMDAIDDLITQTNADLDLWDNRQLRGLDDKEKVRLVMNMARGKYDTDEYNVKDTLLKNYTKLTEGYED